MDLSGTKEVKKELTGIVRSLNTIQKIAKMGKNLGGKGWTKDFNKKRRLSKLHSKRNSLKIELVWVVGNKNTILKIAGIKKMTQ